MKRRILAAALAMSMPTMAFAGDDGDRCSIRHFAGEWLTAFTFTRDATEVDLSCRFVLNRAGEVTTSSCIEDSINAAAFTVTGSFSTALRCKFTGTLNVGDLPLTLNGEINRGRDVLIGLVSTPDGAFEPLTALRTAAYRNARPPRPERPAEPVEDDSDDTAE